MVLPLEDLAVSFRNWLVTNQPLTWNSPKGAWTNAIKQFFDNLGTTEGFGVVYTRRGVKEYLLDLMWIQERPKRFIQLGLESEMSEIRARCIRAFDKLTDTKAYTKVGIFRTNPTLRTQLIQQFRRKLTDHNIPLHIERYLVIFLSYATTGNQITVTCYLLESTGAQSRLFEEQYPFPEN